VRKGGGNPGGRKRVCEKGRHLSTKREGEETQRAYRHLCLRRTLILWGEGVPIKGGTLSSVKNRRI